MGSLFLGNCAEPEHILHEQPEAASSEISKVLRGESRAAVSAVIVPIHNQTGSHQNFDQPEVPPDVLAETVGNLDDAAARSATVPPGARDAQAICAGKLEFKGSRCAIHALSQFHGSSELRSI